ncbi:hypothetical protein A9Q94_01850 [Rhodobacterales bacterium 56_14_T64]|nr:hypothetical protein A9Q94_01850 [Rhodobacterales bacterium 56_14_T64]
MIFATQNYKESCWHEDTQTDLHFGRAKFEWTQVLGFGVSFDFGESPKLINEGNGVYTLTLPKLEQLHPMEHGFSDIQFPKFLSTELFEAFAHKGHNNIVQRNKAVWKVLKGYGATAWTVTDVMERLRMPTAGEVSRMRVEAREIANNRTEAVIKMMLTNDRVLVSKGTEIDVENLLTEKAKESAQAMLVPLISKMITAQLKTASAEGLALDGIPVTPLKELKIEFEQYEEDPSTYVHLEACAA